MPWNRGALGDAEILAVHAAFLNYDQIIYFGGSQNDGEREQGIYNTRLYHCDTGTVQKIDSPDFDPFCCGHSLSAEGTLLIAGGTDRYMKGPDRFAGLRNTAIFRLTATDHGWRETANLSEGVKSATGDRTGGRWYPTLLTLANGNVIALGGIPGKDDQDDENPIPEVFTPLPAGSGKWHRVGNILDPFQKARFFLNRTSLYPRAHLIPSGDIVFAGHSSEGDTVAMRVSESPWSAEFTKICAFTPRKPPQYSWNAPNLAHPGEEKPGGGYDESSTLLPLRFDENYTPRILITGGTTAWVLDLEAWHWDSPLCGWQVTHRRMTGSPRRINGNSVLLPTGEVLCLGGVSDDKVPNRPGVQYPEIFDPFEADFNPLCRPLVKGWRAETSASEKAQVIRDYHSVALLMRDGRVWTAGSDINGGFGIGAIERRIEIYEPWYYDHPDRPEILAAPDRWATGETFVVRTTQAADIKRVAMLRTGSCTHAFNPDQRYITLDFRHAGDDVLLVTAPPNGNIAPTGMYFLFTINSQNLPSIGTGVYQSTTPESEAEREWNALYS